MKKLLSSLVLFSLFSYSQGNKQSTDDVINKNNLKKSFQQNQTINDKNYYKSLLSQQTEKSSNPNDGMLPGMGYSTDTSARGLAVCYQPATITRSGQNSTVNFDTSHDISKIIDIFNVTTSFRAGYGPFSANAMFKYFKSLQKDDYSMSFNYYQKISQTVNMTYSYDKDTMLTDIGKNHYRNGENQMFRLICGDRLADSYEEGAALIMSMKVTLANRFQKETFERSIGVSYGSFFEASQKAQRIAEQHHLSGRIKIDGFQLGGDPTRLSSMLSNRVLECNIRNVAACQDTAKSLLEYASKNFPDQFRRESGVWISPLTTTGGITPGRPVHTIRGFAKLPSYITPEVESARDFLKEAQEKSQAANTRYSNILMIFPNGETAARGLTPEQKVKVDLLNNNAINNLAALRTGFEYGSAVDCWRFPDICIEIKNEIALRLKNIEDNTIKPISCRAPQLIADPRSICAAPWMKLAEYTRVELNQENEQCRAFARMFIKPPFIGKGEWRNCSGVTTYEATKW